ncbi:hypothetical protein JCM6882_003916 [Rhodosporidiobolus microsporus]
MPAPTSRHLVLTSTGRLGAAANRSTQRATSRTPPRAVSSAAANTPSGPSSSPSPPRRRNAHHAASPSPLPFSSPPPPPPSSRRAPPSSAATREPLDPAWEEDLSDDFAASLQGSLARDWAREMDEQAFPEWEGDGRRVEREGRGRGRDEGEGEEGEGLWVGETIEADADADGTHFVPVEEAEGWVDWRSLLADVKEPKKEVEFTGEKKERRRSLQLKKEETKTKEFVQASEKVAAPVPAPSATAPPPPVVETPLAAIPSTAAPSISTTEPVVAPSPSPKKRRRSRPLLLQPTERLTSASLAPYVPPPLPPSSTTSSTPTAPVESHHAPLLTRHDWRLSSPLRRFLRSTPPPLFSVEETATLPLGHGRLVGVGTEAARLRQGLGRVVKGEEQWGWKVRVPEGRERGEWKAADAYVKRMTRLLTLSRQADEVTYQSSLTRWGTPSEREEKGLTVRRAVGVWLSDVGDGEAGEGGGGGGKRARKREESGGAGASGAARVIAEWRAEDGRELDEEGGFKFEEGTILRFTRAASLFPSSPSPPSAPSPSPPSPTFSPYADSTGPQPPPDGAARAGKNARAQTQALEWFVQGTVLEVRDGRLVVAFEKGDVWEMGEEAYQIDLGLDDSSYALQESALENLYLDPFRQREHNAAHVAQAQQTFLQAGVAPTLREWTLQGTELRELVVPPLRGGKNGGAFEPAVDEAEMDDDDSSPAAELAHLPPPSSSLLPYTLPPSPSPAPSPSSSLHPSDLLRSNQLINSWIRRHAREGDPLEMPGDPELGLNRSQTRAIAVALGERLSLIQGPPGTGKSQTIVSLIALLKLHFRVPFPILLAAPTHVSVDHLLSLLVRAGLNPLRCGKAGKVSTPEAEKWTIERRQEQHPLWERMEKSRIESEDARREVVELREAVVSGEVDQRSAEKAGFEAEDRYRKAWRRFIMLEQKLYSSLLATADVFCATALGSGASKVLSMVDFPLVLLDEAAMCTEPVSLIPLMKGAQHATLIGDHKQLPAVVTSQEAKNERLHISLFERLLATSTVKSTLLDTQYRMRPSISAFPNLSFYNSALRDASVVSHRPPPPNSRFFASPTPVSPSPLTGKRASSRRSPSSDSTDFLPVSFVSHPGEERQHRQSILNRSEADLLVEIVGDLLLQNPSLAASDIGIISPYYAQTRLLINTFESGFASSRLRKLLGAKRAAEVAEVEVNTVDGFQGREKRVVLLSTVRSNRGGYIGFLTDRRRLNVALTRARDALIVVGNQETLKRAAMNEWASADPDADAGVWRRFLGWCEARGLVKEYSAGGEGA